MISDIVILTQFLEKKITYCRALDLLAEKMGNRKDAHILLNVAWEKANYPQEK